MHKRGFQLSISVIVVIILGVVMLTLGIVFLNTFIGKSYEIKETLDERTEQQLSMLLDSGQKVAVPFNSVSLQRGDSEVIGVGVLNIDRNNDHEYSVVVEFSDSDVVGDVEIDNWVLYDKEDFVLEPYEQHKMPILFSVPDEALSGQYIFNVEVVERGSSEDYYGLKKVYVTVV